MTLFRTFLVLIAALSVSLSILAQNCQPEWATGFGPQGVGGSVYEIAAFDDGSGPAIYAAGIFRTAGAVKVNGVAKWDGKQWYPLGAGMNGSVYTLAVYDDGSGPALFAGGGFNEVDGKQITNIAKWDGANWSRAGEITSDHSHFYVLKVLDIGSGPELFAGGDFYSYRGIGGVGNIQSIAKWNGTDWIQIGEGAYVQGRVNALEVFDDGTGPALYIGGEFILRTTDGRLTKSIAKWTGKGWENLGLGIFAGYIGHPSVNALRTYDDGTGPALYVGGNFKYAGGTDSIGLARWNGSEWSDVGGLDFGIVYSFHLADLDNDNKPSLLVGGYTTSSAPTLELRSAPFYQWDGEWSSPSKSKRGGSAYSILHWNDALYIGGEFLKVNNLVTSYIAKWEGGRWSALGSGNGVNKTVKASLITSDISGEGYNVYVGGLFFAVGDTLANRVARWDGTQWWPLGDVMGSYGSVNALGVFDSGDGPLLYAAGKFDSERGALGNNIAEWDGDNWSPLAEGVNDEVLCMCTYDDGNGLALYVGGLFTHAGDITAIRIAKWDGEVWSALGTGYQGRPESITVFDDGNGQQIYVGGSWGVSEMKRWNGSKWSDVDGWIQGDVYAFAIFDDGNGPALYAGGTKIVTKDSSHAKVARWDGTNWYSVGSDLGDYQNDRVNSLAVFNDGTGSGNTLYAGGEFNSYGDIGRRYLVHLEGDKWIETGKGSGISYRGVNTLISDNSGKVSTPSLYVGGRFELAGDVPAQNFAIWQACDQGGAASTDYSVVTGKRIEGDINALLDSDDAYLHTQSGLGETIADLHNMEVAILAESQLDGISTLNLKIESHIDEPTGIAQVRMKNFNTTEFDLIHSYTIGSTDSVEWLDDIDAATYRNSNNGRIRMKIKHLVFVPFLAFTFESYIDQVKITVE